MALKEEKSELFHTSVRGTYGRRGNEPSVVFTPITATFLYKEGNGNGGEEK
jgi:hypothetical protein